MIGWIIGIDLVFALVAFLKGKPRLGAFGIFVPGIALVGAARLAKPKSLWARRFYGPAKHERSLQRATRYERRYARIQHRIYDAIGGAPHLERTRAPSTERPLR